MVEPHESGLHFGGREFPSKGAIAPQARVVLRLSEGPGGCFGDYRLSTDPADFINMEIHTGKA